MLSTVNFAPSVSVVARKSAPPSAPPSSPQLERREGSQPAQAPTRLDETAASAQGAAARSAIETSRAPDAADKNGAENGVENDADLSLQPPTAEGAGAGAQESDQSNGSDVELTQEEQAVVAELKARDREVRAHEQAHARVGGQYAGAPSYEYQTGPDGRQYAIGGQVSIDVSPVDGDPAATIEKMEVVKAAALAPAEPSSADRQVAAVADQQRAQAQAALIEVNAAERRGETAEGREATGDLSVVAREGYAAAKDAVAASGDASSIAVAA